LERVAQEQQDDEAFLKMHAHLESQGRHVSDKPAANNYAPKIFSKDPRANGVRSERFAAAMNRLFAANKIYVECYGPPSRGWTRLARGAQP
jgi:hypothetical protein